VAEFGHEFFFINFSHRSWGARVCFRPIFFFVPFWLKVNAD
jgi:hypothetical protein